MQHYLLQLGHDLDLRSIFQNDFLLVLLKMSFKRRIPKHLTSAGCAGNILSAKHICAVLYIDLGNSKMLHELQKPFCERRFFELLATTSPFSTSVRRGGADIPPDVFRI